MMFSLKLSVHGLQPSNSPVEEACKAIITELKVDADPSLLKLAIIVRQDGREDIGVSLADSGNTLVVVVVVVLGNNAELLSGDAEPEYIRTRTHNHDTGTREVQRLPHDREAAVVAAAVLGSQYPTGVTLLTSS